MIATDIGQIELDDAKVIDIGRKNDEICIALDGASLWERCSNGSVGWRSLYNVKVILRGVTGDVAEYWVGSGVSAPHPNPTYPLDAIEIAEYANGSLMLQGYLNREPWYTWKITAGTCTLVWDANIATAT